MTGAAARPEGARRADVVALALLAAVIAVKFAPVLIGRDVLAAGDHAWINLPAKAVTRAAFADGTWPLWNAALSCGTPHLAQGEAGVFYLGNALVHAPVDLYRAYGWTLLAHLAAFAWGVYVLLRVHGCRPHVAGILAAVVGLSPYALFHLPTSNAFQAFCTVPVVVLLERLASRGSSWCAGLLGAAVVSQQLALGRPGLPLYAWLTVAAMGTARAAVGDRPARALARLAAFLALSAGLGVALGAVQLLPTLEFLPASTRGAGIQRDFAEAGGWLTPGRLYAAVLFPVFPRDPGRFAAYHASDPYLGLVPAGLALLGLGAVRRRDPGAVAAATGLACALLLALGPTLAGVRLAWRLPPLSLLRYPGRALPVFLCLGAVLAGLAWERLAGEGRAPGRRALVAAGALVAAASATFLWGARETVAPMVAVSQAALQAAAPAAVALWPAWRRRRRAWEAALVAACAIQLLPLLAYYGYFGMPRSRLLDDLAPLAPVARAETGSRRILVGGMTAGAGRGANPPALGNGAVLAGAHVVNEYNQFTWGRWRRFLHATLHRQARGIAALPPERGVSDLVGLQWMYVDAGGTPPGAGWRPADPGAPADGLRLWRRTGGATRAGIVHEVVRDARLDPESLAEIARSGAVDFRRRALIADPSAPEPAPGDPSRDRVVELASGPNGFRFDVESDGGYLVIRDHDAPGWRAFLDGHPVPHYLADGFFKAVALPPGEHRVELAYRPRSFVLGAGISAAAAAAALVAAGVVGLARRRRGSWP